MSPIPLASPEMRVIARPFEAYAEEARVHVVGYGVAVGRGALMLLAIGSFLSLSTAGRHVWIHLLVDPFAWVFVPFFQSVVPLGLCWLAGLRGSAARTLALYFVGNGPWLLLFSLASGACLVAPDPAALLRFGLGYGIIPAVFAVTFGWSVVLTTAFYRSAMSLPRRTAALLTVAHYAGTTALVLSYYLALDQIQPHLPWWGAS